METCQNCFDLRHHRCRGCGCSVCAKRSRRVKLPRKDPVIKRVPAAKKAPVPRKPRKNQITPQVVQVAQHMRGLGATYREIGSALGIDYSYLARALKAIEAQPEASSLEAPPA